MTEAGAADLRAMIAEAIRAHETSLTTLLRLKAEADGLLAANRAAIDKDAAEERRAIEADDAAMRELMSAEQSRVATLSALAEALEQKARAMLETAGLAFVLGVPMGSHDAPQPSRREPSMIAAAFAEAQTMVMSLRASLAELGSELVAQQRWDDARRVLSPLTGPDQLGAFAHELLREAHLRPARLARLNGDEEVARAAFSGWLAWDPDDDVAGTEALAPLQRMLDEGRHADVSAACDGWLEQARSRFRERVQAKREQAVLGLVREALARNGAETALQLAKPLLTDKSHAGSIRTALLEPAQHALAAEQWEAARAALRPYIAAEDGNLASAAKDLWTQSRGRPIRSALDRGDRAGALAAATAWLREEPDAADAAKLLQENLADLAARREWQVAGEAFITLAAVGAVPADLYKGLRDYPEWQAVIAERVEPIVDLEHLATVPFEGYTTRSRAEITKRRVPAMAFRYDNSSLVMCYCFWSDKLFSSGYSVIKIDKKVQNAICSTVANGSDYVAKREDFSVLLGRRDAQDRIAAVDVVYSSSNVRAYGINFSPSQPTIVWQGWQGQYVSDSARFVPDPLPAGANHVASPELLGRVKPFLGSTPSIASCVSPTGLVIAVVDDEFRVHLFRRKLSLEALDAALRKKSGAAGF